MIRTGARGYADGPRAASSNSSNFLTSLCLGLQGGMVIGLSPILNFGSPELKAKVHCASRFLDFFLVLIFLDRSGSVFGQEVHLSCHFGGARR